MEKEYALLRIHLNEAVPAFEFAYLCQFLNQAYDNFLWIEHANKVDQMPPEFFPTEEEKLYIERAEIGTPNMLDLLGLYTHLNDAVHFMAEHFDTILNVGSATVMVIKTSNTFFSFRKNLKEIFNKTSSESQGSEEKIPLERPKNMKEESDGLLDKGKMDPVIHEHKIGLSSHVEFIRSYSDPLITDVEMFIIKSKD